MTTEIGSIQSRAHSQSTGTTYETVCADCADPLTGHDSALTGDRSSHSNRPEGSAMRGESRGTGETMLKFGGGGCGWNGSGPGRHRIPAYGVARLLRRVIHFMFSSRNKIGEPGFGVSTAAGKALNISRLRAACVSHYQATGRCYHGEDRETVVLCGCYRLLLQREAS